MGVSLTAVIQLRTMLLRKYVPLINHWSDVTMLHSPWRWCMLAAYTKMLEQLQQMTWLETKGLSYQYQATSIYRGWHMLALPIKHFSTRYIQPTHITIIVLCPDISRHFDVRTSHCYVKMRAFIPVTFTNLLWRNYRQVRTSAHKSIFPSMVLIFLLINRWISRWLYSALCIFTAGL